MPTYKYALRPAEGGKWTKGTLIDSIEWEDEKQAKEGLEKQFPGNKAYVKMINKRPHIENRAETVKSSKEVGDAGLAAMRARLK